ncbi:hypothetical protein OX283_000580 [Flavobacterium sp. SUN052]|uniref:hypothetical protein n=1 Tax=Flavobacterium sp. SUN052 TaxID=3002441 RepID=UPI00237E4AB2|nr:hypothetical protein [Flavobacterium sp. SUN052]MEC4003137.1 hypothetical protein [Flavobacterium sp. SUN052]
MTGLFSKYIFIFLWTSFSYLVLRRELEIKRKFKFSFIFLPIYILLIIAQISFSIIDFQEYKSFNNLVSKQIREIRINKNKVAKNNFDKLFEELKHDNFTWVNHPIVIQKVFITVITSERKYFFLIQKTTNQGVLVSRLNQKGNDYVINRNDNLLQYIN